MSEQLAETIEAVEPAGEETTPVVETDVVETPAAPAAPAFDPYDDPRMVEFVQAQAAQIADQRLQALIAEAQAAQAQPTQQGPTLETLVDEFGQINPDALVSMIQNQNQQTLAQIDQRIQQIAAPLQAREQAETVAEGEQRIQDMIADDIARNGDFPVSPDTGKSSAKDLVRPLADALFPQIAGTYGNTPRAAELAISKATGIVRQLVTEAGQAAVSAHVNRNAELATARTEPGTGAVGVETLPDQIYKPGQLALKYGSNASRIRG